MRIIVLMLLFAAAIAIKQRDARPIFRVAGDRLYRDGHIDLGGYR